MARQLGKNLLQPEPGWTREYCFLENAKPGMFFSNVDLDNNITGDKWRAVGDTNRLEQNSAWYVGDTLGRSFYFKFTGTSVRILLKNFTTHAYNITVTIDNISYGGSVPAYSSEYSLVVFEKLDLIKGEHNVKVTTNGYASGAPGTDYTFITAVDYADLSAKVGDVLTQPEPGWSRFDDRNNAIRYEGNWQIYNNQSSGDGYLGSYHIKNNDKDKLGHVFFNFTGTKLRILAYRTDGLYFDNTKIVIDGVTYDIPRVDKPSSVKTVVVFEKTDLSPGTHSVDMYDYYLNLDAIDVGSSDLILATAKVGDQLLQPEPGWKRFDDTDSNIRYTGSWKTITNDTAYYGNSITFKHDGFSADTTKCEFSFTGTGIRIISQLSNGTSYSSSIKITIDGSTETYTIKSTKIVMQSLVYEKLSLSPGTHKVVIEAQENIMDAIDIQGGSILTPSKVGDVLLQPEVGWTRIDDSDPRIRYEGNWKFFENVKANYNGTRHYISKADGIGVIRFSFYGSALRIIGYKGSYEQAMITIDDSATEIISFQPHATSDHTLLMYEKLGLKKGYHTVKISGDFYNLDAIDIPIDGSMLKLNEKRGQYLLTPETGWQRFDDSHEGIKYIDESGGNWGERDGGRSPEELYNGKNHIKKGKGKIKFSFTGSRIRILPTVYKDWFGSVYVEIDGINVGNYKISSYAEKFPYARGCMTTFEQLYLDYKKHDVVIYTTDDDALSTLDAIDIDSQGELLRPTAGVGDVLKEPEPGWKRFDDTDKSFKYLGDWWSSGTTPEWYNNTFKFIQGGSGEVQFNFSGTKLRIIGCIHEPKHRSRDIKIIIDGKEEMYSEQGTQMQYQTLVYEKTDLVDGVHTVVIKSGTTSRYPLTFDAIDINDTGVLLPYDDNKKTKVSLYEKESGKIFVDDFDSINPKWLMSLSSAFNNAIKKGFLRMNHSADKDVMLLIDKPQGNFAIQVIADYAPTKDGDEGGLLLYQNEKNKVEFLESYAANSSQSNKEWLAICKEDRWDFYTKTDTFFDYVNKDSLSAERIGVVLKRGTAEGFVPLDINKIIMTKSNMLRLRQLYENYKIVLKDTADNTLSTNIVATAHTGIDILLPSLEFEGIVEIYDEENELLAKKQTIFYGGDMYCMGSSLQIKMNNDELNTTDPTNLGYIVNNERIVKMTIVNDNIGAATNIKLSIQQYMEKIGYTWALISLDGTNYLNEIQIDSIAAQSTRNFWVKVVKDTNSLAFEPIYFNVHLKHN
ncbi:protein containing cell adhesion domain protein [Bacillus cereus]|uniref:protein containing cell adhesion domain protein n=1 Tax=Bacillus cereus TaxID=1396 RepID=UPI0035C8709D